MNRTATTVIEREAPPADRTAPDTESAPPADWGECPACGKKLFPRDKITGAPVRDIPVGTGFDSRAKCGGCGTVLYYCGYRQWAILLDEHLTEEDRFADRMGF